MKTREPTPFVLAYLTRGPQMQKGSGIHELLHEQD